MSEETGNSSDINLVHKLSNIHYFDKCLDQDEMGETWEVTDVRVGRKVIAYVPSPEIQKDAAAIEKISQTARLVGTLNHTGIIPLLGMYTDAEHGFFVVRQLVIGKTLDVYWEEYTKRHGIQTTNQAVAILSKIAQPLRYAHKAGVVHGNLRPKNIIVDRNGQVFVDNFALLPARITEAAIKNPYLPPEIVNGHPATSASDVYALGVIAYELLAGSLPFVSEMDSMLLPVSGMSDAVNAVIQKALAREPYDRFNSCNTFVKTLKRSLEEPQRIILTANVPVSSSSGKYFAGKTLGMTLLGLFVLFVIVVPLLFPPMPGEPSPQIAPPQTVDDTPATKPEPKTQAVVLPSSSPSSYKDIFEAAEKGKASDVKFFVDNGEKVDQTDEKGWTPVHYAACYNPDVEVLTYLVYQKASVNATLESGSTPLDIANTAEKKKILQTAGGRNGSLINAAKEGPVRDIQYFLDKGESINVKDRLGWTPIHMAAGFNSDERVVQYLVSKGADVNTKLNDGKTPLHLAAKENPNIKVLEYLISQRTDVNAGRSEGIPTPLDVANTEEKKQMLRTAGAKSGSLYVALKEGTIEDVQYLFDRGEKLEAKDLEKQSDKEGMTPLHLAAWYNPHVDVLKFLVSQGMDIKSRVKGNRNFSVLHFAARNPKKEITEYLLFSGVDVNISENHGGSPLHEAAWHNPNAEVTELLISKGANVNVKNKWEDIPLHYAARRNSNVEVTKCLISHGAKINAKNNTWGNTPLYDAVRENPNIEVVKYLVSQGADINAKNNDRSTPLHEAAYWCCGAEVTELLISKGGDVNGKNKWGDIPLHYAARRNSNVEFAKCLISHGANINAKSNGRVTPLHEAARENPNIEVVQYLISQGADVNVKSNDGKTPLDMANTEEKKQILREAMKK